MLFERRTETSIANHFHARPKPPCLSFTQIAVYEPGQGGKLVAATLVAVFHPTLPYLRCSRHFFLKLYGGWSENYYSIS